VSTTVRINNTYCQRFQCTNNGTQKLIDKTTSVPEMVHVAPFGNVPNNYVAVSQEI